MFLIGFILVSACVTSAATWGVAWWFYRTRMRAEIDRVIIDMQDEFEQRVKAGVTDAATDLLPMLREQVALGFQDALARSEAAGLVENAAGVVNVGGEIVAGGLQAILGGLKRKA